MEWLVALVLAAALVAVGRLAVLQRRATELGVENARWRTRLVAACLTHP